MKLADLLPDGAEAEWTCGHRAGAICAECYRLLAAKAHELQAECDRLEDERNRLEDELARLKRGDRS